jgi:predicted phosphodiesterase
LATLSAQAYTNLTSAYSAMGFDPSAPGNAVVVFFSDAHMDARYHAISHVLTTNLDPRLVNIVNAMDPPPGRIVVAGDVSTSYCMTPGGHANSNDSQVGTIEMTWWSSAVLAFTNIAQTNILWVPGNHDQSVDETNAELFCRMFPNMPPYQAFELAGVKFFLLNSGSYCNASDSEARWLRQQVAQTPPTQTVAVVTHFPSVNDTIYRGMYPLLREVFGNWQTRWWSLYGHTHGRWNQVFTVGATNVALFNVGTANTNTSGGLGGDAGFAFLCLSNKEISGIVYYRYNATAIGEGDFEVDYSHEQFGPPRWPSWDHPEPFVAAFEATSGLLWRRLKTREPAPEVVRVNAGNSVNWYCYTTNLQLALPLGQCANRATHFLLLMSQPRWDSRADFSIDLTNWIQAPFRRENFHNDIVAIPIPPEVAGCVTGYFRFTAPWADNYICGWGLSTTNGPPLAPLHNFRSPRGPDGTTKIRPN